ncbi:Atu4866 domain-containing protein [Streptomyces sp. MBT62]|uniref:Atu4866 domain-containing protein n=1 Tax=Streptomyces sp. MBT62 TaxID=2800410 RepID=UPI00190E3950|nr:Atu4866 domain-containing protein [Streptomyces sp. MBT62]MBK3570475.1 Atu4866 domain-containing protein [Streptomyces sp. MBT62]
MSTTPTDTVTWNGPALDEIVTNDAGRPVLFTNARVLTMDPLIGTLTGADVLLVGALLVGVGPGIVTAAQDDNAIVVDCTGMTVVPAVVDTAALVGGRGQRSEYVATLTPGNTGDLLVVPDELAPDVAGAVATLLTRPEEVRALVANGKPVLWSGTDAPGRPTAPEAGIPDAQDLTGSPRIGVWIDENGFLHQELTADGRYDETRGGRPHAYEGRYWIDGDRIDYLDDLGFWAFGEFRGDELHHAGYAMRLGTRSRS